MAMVEEHLNVTRSTIIMELVGRVICAVYQESRNHWSIKKHVLDLVGDTVIVLRKAILEQIPADDNKYSTSFRPSRGLVSILTERCSQEPSS